MGSTHINGEVLETRILPVNTTDLGHFKNPQTLETWELPTDIANNVSLQEAARCLKTTNIPVAFPTETVYGLGADATRSAAVKGIYKAKGRPSDNPLIVHVSDLTMLRSLLTPNIESLTNGANLAHHSKIDPIPQIYKPLIQKFWPGPLTILLPNSQPSHLAPEVTAGLQTVGVRMPSSQLALSLIALAGVPLAAPSANASTKPSPTTAEHVLHDLSGRISMIIDGGACTVGMESTVVDGLCNPPVVLRPGGVSLEAIKECAGWERVVKGYVDKSEVGGSAPRAPGMKYKHYSPKAKVLLFEASSTDVQSTVSRSVLEMVKSNTGGVSRFGLVRTRHWQEWAGWDKWIQGPTGLAIQSPEIILQTPNSFSMRKAGLLCIGGDKEEFCATVFEIDLGKETKSIAHGLFSALRELDHRGVDVIFVEGIQDEGDIAAAVMNRLRKAATEIKS